MTAFALGAAAVGALTLVAAFALAVLAEAGEAETLRLALGQVEFVAFERAGATTSTTFGPGLALLPLVGGALNAALAALLVRQ